MAQAVQTGKLPDYRFLADHARARSRDEAEEVLKKPITYVDRELPVPCVIEPLQQNDG